jgi:Fe2+ or Zn2+ uptake regulation protein
VAHETILPGPRKEIMEYLRAHPSAADTIDGIIQWWLPLQHYEMERENIEKALDGLVKQGLVEYISTGDKKIFRLAAHEHRDGDE